MSSTVGRRAVSEDLLEVCPPFVLFGGKVTSSEAARFGGQSDPFIVHGAFLSRCRRKLRFSSDSGFVDIDGRCRWAARLEFGRFGNHAKSLFAGVLNRSATRSRVIRVFVPWTYIERSGKDNDFQHEIPPWSELCPNLPRVSPYGKENDVLCNGRFLVNKPALLNAPTQPRYASM